MHCARLVRSRVCAEEEGKRRVERWLRKMKEQMGPGWDQGEERSGLAARGEGAKGDVEDRALRALRERWERRDREEAPAGEPTVLGDGVSSPPAASKMLPRSLPYGGGGASVPELGASPHFFTLASMKTKPDWPKLM